MKTIIFAAAGWLAAAVCPADDLQAARLDHWHQWRGPLAEGVAPQADPPIRWDAQQNVRWKTAIPGEGNATPIVWDDQVFVVTAIPTERRIQRLAPVEKEPPGGYRTPRPEHFYRFTVYCLDRHNGQIRWQQDACEAVPHAGRHLTNTYASASPTTDGQRLYVSFGSQGIYCYDLAGQLLWSRDLGDMITRFGWGEGASPVIHENSLIVNWDHEGESFLTVLDPATGQTKWRVARDEPTSWTTPRVVSFQGRSQVIVPATRRITSYDLDSGQLIWECGGLTTNVIPCPAVYGEFVICMSGHQGTEALAVRLDSRGDVTEDARQIVWRLHRDTPYVPSPLLYGNLLYITKANLPIMTCLDAASGKPLGESVRLPEMQSLYASPVGAAGRVYFTSREGTTLVIKHQPQLEVLAVNRLPEGIDASAAIVGRQLFLRGKQNLYCLEDR